MNTGGHPADAFDNVGGTLANHVARGDQVTVVVMSHGVFSHDLETISARREGRGEARAGVATSTGATGGVVARRGA
jgi:LmbE family N-acetylglucosaminyl deacetylase